MNSLHFITGLPRSGSTLLSAILRQNPRFYTNISSPVAGMYGALQKQLSGANEYNSFTDSAARLSVLSGLFPNYYESKTGRPVIFDTNRAWSAKIDGLNELFPDAKYICCVRSIEAIIASVEHAIRAHPLELSRIFGFDPHGNIYKRVDTLMSNTGMIGHAYGSLKEAYFGPHKAKMIIIKYDDLVENAQDTIHGIYRLLNEPVYEHEFDNVEFHSPEFDRVIGVPGLHSVRPRIAKLDRASLLPPDISKRYSQLAFWVDHPSLSKMTPD